MNPDIPLRYTCLISHSRIPTRITLFFNHQTSRASAPNHDRRQTMSTDRVYPLARPKGHKPPMKRWKLEYDKDPLQIQTAYFGVQRHDAAPATLSSFRDAVKTVQERLDVANTSKQSPPMEAFKFLEGDDTSDAVTWVCYWADPTAYGDFIERLSLADLYADIGKPSTVGLWCERFTTPTSRLETNYSGLDYLPGLAKLPGARPMEHTLTAYWGAARDRIPGSSHDSFARAGPELTQPPKDTPSGTGSRLFGTNQYDNLVHIRSGQFWANCDATETEAYEEILEPTLRAGLRYVWDNRDESGAVGLRFLRNQYTSQAEGGEAKETCAAGFFRSLEDLERWAKRHPSHLAIFNGAIKHARTFGDERKFRTWHEVSILKRGEAQFEYLNCLPQTGVIQYLALETKRI